LPSAEEVIKQNYTAAITFLFFTIFYLAFTSNFLAEWIAIKRPIMSLTNFTRITILLLVGFFGVQSDLSTL
jgi:hypothetical protein